MADDHLIEDEVLITDEDDNFSQSYSDDESVPDNDQSAAVLDASSSSDDFVREQTQLVPNFKHDSEVTEEQPESEEQVKVGFLEIKKLDRHLRKLSKMETETKRCRLRFEAQMVKEFEQLNVEYPNSANNCPAVHANTVKFLAIDMPIQNNQKRLPNPLENGQLESSETESGDDSIYDEGQEDDEADVIPVFKTELIENEFSRNIGSSYHPISHVNGSRSSSSEYVTARSSASDSNDPSVPPTNESGHTTDFANVTPRSEKEAFVKTKAEDVHRAGKQKHRRTRPKKDFVARNIQLAMDAASNVPMTDDEKKRLSELLADINEEGPIEPHAAPESESELALVVKSNDDVSCSRNSNSTAVSIGYKPGDSEIEKLNDIDNKLRSICSQPINSSRLSSNVNGSAYSSLDTWRESSSNASNIPPLALTAGTRSVSHYSNVLNVKSGECALSLIMEDVNSAREEDRLGEQSLVEVREARELSTRLENIDEQLALLTGSHPYPVEVDLPKLAPSEVRSLVSQCFSALSNHESDDGESSQVTYDDALANAVRLPESTLRNLLEQAKQELGLLTLEATQTVYSSKGSRGNELYDNETWTFLREVEANLEYPPAFLRSLPDEKTELTGGNSNFVSLNNPDVPAVSTFIDNIKESEFSGSCSPSLPPLSGRRHSIIRSNQGASTSGELRSNSSSSFVEKDDIIGPLPRSTALFSYK